MQHLLSATKAPCLLTTIALVFAAAAPAYFLDWIYQEHLPVYGPWAVVKKVLFESPGSYRAAVESCFKGRISRTAGRVR